MIPIEVEVYSLADPTAMIGVLNARISPKYMEELRGQGGGKINLSITDPKIIADPTLVQARNVLKFKVDGQTVGALVISDRSAKIIQERNSAEQFEVSGESLRTWLKDAIVYPEGTLRSTSYAERAFNFSSVARGTWYNPAQWIDTVNVVKWGDVVGSYWRYAPANWPDVPEAYWVWSSNAPSGIPYGDNYFRYEFAVDVAGTYSFFFAADSSYTVYVDGQLVTSSQPGAVAWSATERVDMELQTGNHVFAVKVTNQAPAQGALVLHAYDVNLPKPPTPELRHGGLIAAVFRAGDAAKQIPATLISYTGKVGDLNWKVAPYPDPLPGWTPGEIMLTLLDEAKDRGVRFPQWVNPAFTATTDSYGNVWARDLDWSFTVGSSLSVVADKLEELVCDLWVDPETLELHMVAERGVDRSDYGLGIDGVTPVRPILVFEKGKNLGESSIDSTGEIKNALLIQTSDGWMVADDVLSGSQITYGRIESMLDTGLSSTVSRAVASTVFGKKAFPEVGASYEVFATPGHVPWQDFGVGDWVLAPDERGLLVKRRVMSISVTEDSKTGQPTYAVEFDTIFQDNEDKVTRWMSKMSDGTLGGSVANSGGGSSLPIGQPTVVSTAPAAVPVPNSPDAPYAQSTGLWEANGVQAYAQVIISWPAVSGNTDGSATVPAGYEVWGHLNGEPENTYQRLTTVFTNSAKMQHFEVGSTWQFKVRAYNVGPVYGAFSTDVVHTMLAPAVPLAAPNPPSLSSNRGVLSITWDGLLDGEVPDPQFRYVYALISHAGENVWTHMGAMLQRDGRTIYISGLPVGATYDVALRAVDGMGIQSAASPVVTTTITGIVGSDIIANSIDANAITAGTITAMQLSPLIGNTLDIAGNLSITAVAESINDVSAATGLVAADLAVQRTHYNFDATGATISDPASTASLKLEAGKISMLVNGVEVSYWTSGIMYVNSFEGQNVILGNHQISKEGTGTVVRRV